jgi:hypothetical protein
VDLTTTVNADAAPTLAAELHQILHDLGLGDAVSLQ